MKRRTMREMWERWPGLLLLTVFSEGTAFGLVLGLLLGAAHK